MPIEKIVVLESKVTSMLQQYPNGLGFTQIFAKLQAQKRPKGYYDRVGSNSTLSLVLKSLRRKEAVVKDIDTGKYILTKKGRDRAAKLGLIEEIESIGGETRSDQVKIMDKNGLVNMSQTPTSTYILIEGENKLVPINELSNVYASLLNELSFVSKEGEEKKNEFVDRRGLLSEILIQKCGYGRLWEKTISEIAKETGLDYESQKEAIFKKLFEGISKIAIVSIVDPALLIKEVAL